MDIFTSSLYTEPKGIVAGSATFFIPESDTMLYVSYTMTYNIDNKILLCFLWFCGTHECKPCSLSKLGDLKAHTIGGNLKGGNLKGWVREA